ncbi:hypothetical protein PSYMO_26044, partial [Pseudomonas amygdali pv. mori str. 301020]
VLVLVLVLVGAVMGRIPLSSGKLAGNKTMPSVAAFFLGASVLKCFSAILLFFAWLTST